MVSGRVLWTLTALACLAMSAGLSARLASAASNGGAGLTSTAGSSAGVVSGYTITASTYTLNASNPLHTDAIVITYSGSPVPSQIHVSPDGVSGHFYYTEAGAPAGNQCTADATTITCSTTTTGGGHQGTVAELANLTVVLTQ